VDLVQTVVISKTQGHQSAFLQVHGDIANIVASMEVLERLTGVFSLSTE
jgi:site-specific DNA recombinase